MVDLTQHFGPATGTRYVSGSDLVPLGKRFTAVITAVDVKEFSETVNGKEVMVPKVILDLAKRNGEEWPKQACLTPAKSRQLMEAFGGDGDHWVGRQIELWGEKGVMNKRPIIALRVAPLEAQPAPTPPAPTPSAPKHAQDWSPPRSEDPGEIVDDEIPF